MTEIIKDCKRRGITRVLLLSAASLCSDYCVIITTKSIAEAVMEYLQDEGAERVEGDGSGIPLRGRN